MHDSTGRSGAQILVDQLLIHGADLGFGVPGESYLSVLDAMHGVGDRFRYIVCRHEASASNMAEAYGKLTGRPGLCFVTRGPGATHASTGLHTGRQDSTPMILFVGQVARRFLGREAFQEIDYGKMFGEVSKLVIQLEDPARIPELISRAFHTAMNGRPGPVVVVLPEDVLDERADVADAKPFRTAQAAPSPADMAELGGLLAKAKRPLMILGGGGWTEAACADIARFAERFQLPTAAAFRRQDLLDNRADLYVGDIGLGVNPSLAQAVEDSDLLIVVGPRLGEATTGGYDLVGVPTPRQIMVHVHLDPEELGHVYAADLPICAAPGSFAAAAIALTPGAINWTDWTRQLRVNYLKNIAVAPDADISVDMGQVVAGLSERLGPDAIICNGAGNYTTWVHRYFQYRRKGSQLAPTSGAMGYGFPAGIAAKLVRPDAPVVVFAGDGCFLMASQELATAVRYGLALIIVVVNNNSFGTIRMHQERHFPNRVFATDLNNPDFVALAKAFGAQAERVTATDQFWPAFDRALANDGPTLVELSTDIEVLTPRLRLSKLRATSA